jgi:hypothetical protein
MENTMTNNTAPATAPALKLTAMEADLLNLLAYDLYNASNGSRPTCLNDVGAVWTWSIVDAWPHATRALPGVASSLVKKGLISTTLRSKGLRRGEPDDATMGLTAAGYEAWQTVDSGK